jgi:hypothetical protein
MEKCIKYKSVYWVPCIVPFGTIWDSRTPKNFAPDRQIGVKFNNFSGSGSGLPPINSM